MKLNHVKCMGCNAALLAFSPRGGPGETGLEREAPLPIRVEQRQERDNQQDGHAHLHSSLSSRTHQLFLFPKTFASHMERTLHSPFRICSSWAE